MKKERPAWELDGFIFYDEEQAKQAEKEIEAIRYMKERVDLDNPDMVLEMYNRIMEQDILKTPVGTAYLKELQEYLTTIPYIMNRDIKPIPVVAESAPQGMKEPERAGRERETKKEESKNTTAKTDRKIREININYKKRFRTMCSVSAVLLIIVIAMFAITLTGNSITILNYENEIINKYEHWEKELEEREAALHALETKAE